MADGGGSLPAELGDAQELIGAAYAADVVTAWTALKRSRIRTAAPAPNTRASSIGNPCERALYYERTANDQRLPHREDLQAIFDLGNELEGYVLRELEAAGIRVVERQRPFVDRALELSGTSDATLLHPRWPKPVVAEIKGLNPFTAEKVRTLEDIVSARTPWLRRYYDQMQSYLFLRAEPLGLFVLFDKSRAGIKVIPVPLDYGYAESLLKKAERVRDAVRAGEPPPFPADTEPCERCPFQHVCLPPRVNAGARLLSDEDAAEVTALLETRERTQTAHEEWMEADEELKEILPAEAGALLVPGWEVTSKWIARAGYTPKPVAPGGYYRRTYRRTPGGGA